MNMPLGFFLLFIGLPGAALIGAWRFILCGGMG